MTDVRSINMRRGFTPNSPLLHLFNWKLVINIHGFWSAVNEYKLCTEERRAVVSAPVQIHKLCCKTTQWEGGGEEGGGRWKACCVQSISGNPNGGEGGGAAFCQWVFHCRFLMTATTHHNNSNSPRLTTASQGPQRVESVLGIDLMSFRPRSHRHYTFISCVV